MTPPPIPSILLEVLPAAYGDALIVSCPVPGGIWRLLVDAGPDETWPILSRRLKSIEPNADGRRRIDLAVVSHIDHDHIGGARFLFADTTLSLSFGDVWFNARRHLPEVARGVAEGETLASILGAPLPALPWNAAFGGAAVATSGDGAFVEVPSAPGYPRLTLLSPTPKRLASLARVWDAELDRLHRHESNSAPSAERGSEFPNLEALAARATSRDGSVPNGSSIAMLVEHQGASLLLAADAFPTVLGSALLALARHRGASLPLRVDAFKLSHHGSRANLMTTLLNVVNASYYVASTNNTRFGHPDDESLARVVLCGGVAPTLCFNYATPRNLRWSDEALKAKYAYAAWYADDPDQGLHLPLSGPA